MYLTLQPLENLLKKGKTLSKNIFQLKMCFDLGSFSKMKDLFIISAYWIVAIPLGLGPRTS